MSENEHDECQQIDIRTDIKKIKTPVVYVIDRALEYERLNESKGKHKMG